MDGQHFYEKIQTWLAGRFSLLFLVYGQRAGWLSGGQRVPGERKDGSKDEKDDRLASLL